MSPLMSQRKKFGDFPGAKAYGAPVHRTIYEFETVPHFAQAEAMDTVPSLAGTPAHAPGRPVGRQANVPLVGLIRNPRSHRNIGCPPEMADHPNILTEMPATRAALRDVLAEFAQRGVEYLAVDGGDGTVRDVLTCGAAIFGNNWPTIIALPKGKTNALTVDLGLPNKWSLTEALNAVIHGRTVKRRPLMVQPWGEDEACVLGFILGAGAFNSGTQAGQKAHHYGAFNSFAVGITIVGVVLQALFGRDGNRWRAGTPMRLLDGRGGPEFPHSRHGKRGERFLFLASTLEQFPLGIRPFGKRIRQGLKLGILDAPVRWILGTLPFVLIGWESPVLESNGMQRIDVDEVDMDLGDSFIIDGEAFPAGRYILRQGPVLHFVIP